jgi:plasmid maintenance system antidote protein VapI
VNQNWNEQGARFEQLILALDLNQTTFSLKFNQRQSSISQIVKGKRGIPHKLQIVIAKRHGQSVVDWLMTGEGELNLHKAADEVKEKTAEYRRTTPGEQLQYLLDGHEKRIADLETELRLLKDMEAEVHRLRGLVEGLVKGGVVKE